MNKGGHVTARELGEVVRTALDAAGVAVFDAGEVVGAVDGADGIHMTAEEHVALGRALAPLARALLDGRAEP